MKVIIDTDAQAVDEAPDNERNTMRSWSKESFELISGPWVKTGWDEKHSHIYVWVGWPTIRLQMDTSRFKKFVDNKPDMILETSVAHGGSLLYTGICARVQGGGLLVGIKIRSRNREAIEAHEPCHITLIEGDSIDPGIIQAEKQRVGSGKSPLSNALKQPTKDHVLPKRDVSRFGKLRF